MTSEERSLVMKLVMVPGRPPAISPEEFLRQFGAADGVALGVDLLADAVDRRDAADVEWSLIVCSKFGFTDVHLQPLLSLAFADWHEQHENVASALGIIRSPASVPVLVHLAQWVPGYLRFDNVRALATKAIWALGGIGGDKARLALEGLTRSDSSIVAGGAAAQLRK
jgi:hypothetical protein